MQSLTLSQAKPEPGLRAPPSLPPSFSSLQQQLKFCVAEACGCSMLAPPRPELQGLSLLAELSSFCPMPRRVDFEFPVGGMGGCFSLPWRQCWRCWWKEALSASLSQVQLSAELGGLQEEPGGSSLLISFSSLLSSGFTVPLVLPLWGSGWAQTDQNVPNKCELGRILQQKMVSSLNKALVLHAWIVGIDHSPQLRGYLMAAGWVSLWKLGAVGQQSWTLRNDSNLQLLVLCISLPA